ncbi:type II toxin-antitoxin system RelE/ParE family toxin [Marinobacter fuscus]|uniref:Type II toxin-antitoxin system RelE/ParE family toxin n=1 Tax=Marinobacter fuscus TaxID=2109942 RepID=A0A2T1K814_9GAMM|nr:type II toxin-antitoxin system RelE/ParE family toxin [Marinobacter fuscus]PSF06210.1 type II toxin-antitoxin system RelE/ParE family toxin [Marinobacter fuscus]
MHKLTYKKAALKAIRKMPKPQAQKLQGELEAMARDPQAYWGDWKPMKGGPFWRLRQGSYRAICSIDDGELVVLVLKVGSKGDVYK